MRFGQKTEHRNPFQKQAFPRTDFSAKSVCACNLFCGLFFHAASPEIQSSIFSFYDPHNLDVLDAFGSIPQFIRRSFYLSDKNFPIA
ncbi:hypothetical protein [Fournierella sp.]|uniref:hypothetical protein n=1 Tax=Allofournierella sp. TaxID=1940256 RepID=UPI00307A9658